MDSEFNSTSSGGAQQVPIAIDEDSDKSVEELQDLFEEYMMPPAQPSVAS